MDAGDEKELTRKEQEHLKDLKWISELEIDFANIDEQACSWALRDAPDLADPTPHLKKRGYQIEVRDGVRMAVAAPDNTAVLMVRRGCTYGTVQEGNLVRIHNNDLNTTPVTNTCCTLEEVEKLQAEAREKLQTKKKKKVSPVKAMMDDAMLRMREKTKV